MGEELGPHLLFAAGLSAPSRAWPKPIVLWPSLPPVLYPEHPVCLNQRHKATGGRLLLWLPRGELGAAGEDVGGRAALTAC